MLQSRGQFQSAAAYVRLILAEQADCGIVRNRSPWFVDLLLAHKHAAGKNQRTGALTALNKATLHKKQIESAFLEAQFSGKVFFGARFVRIRHGRGYSLKKLKGRSLKEWPFRWH
jgi:hypothetical protein